MSPTLPPGSCDCHVHVVGDCAAYPMVEDRPYTPAPAPHAALLEHLRRNGLQRAVLVQPSFYGTDNLCMLDSLAGLRGAGRGVAVVDDDIDDASLARLHAAGVRGLRVNVESTGVRDPRAIEAALLRWAQRIAPLGWHLQVYAAPAALAAIADVLRDLAVPVVLDHFAMVPATMPANDPVARRLLALVRSGNAYVKLSAPYRIDSGAAPQAVTALARTFLDAAPQRVLWGSDWPHTNREPGRLPHEVSRYRELDPGVLPAQLGAWLPDAVLRQQVLVDNPAHLYGF
jgi:predicted TIM-barrel fold metal-dependent hydrolase